MNPYFDPKTKRFYNYQGENISHLNSGFKLFFKYISDMRSSFYPSNFKFSEWLEPQAKIEERSQSPKITWLGHSTVLVQITGKNIITDPVFFDIKSFGFTSCPRKMQLGIALESLPPIDIILISHMHRDHADISSLKFIHMRGDNPIVLAPKKSASFFNRIGFSRVHDFSWWEKHEIDQINFNFLPAIHWSRRGLFDINKCLWGSWMIQANNTNIYFAGDSAYDQHYKQIASQFDNINLALMPIGPTQPREIFKKAHMDAQEVLQAFIDLNAKILVPIHWGTFRLGTDGFNAALDDLNKAAKIHASVLKDKDILVSKFGQCLDL